MPNFWYIHSGRFMIFHIEGSSSIQYLLYDRQIPPYLSDIAGGSANFEFLICQKSYQCATIGPNRRPKCSQKNIGPPLTSLQDITPAKALFMQLDHFKNFFCDKNHLKSHSRIALLPLAHKKSYRPVRNVSSSTHLPTKGGSAKVFVDNVTNRIVTNILFHIFVSLWMDEMLLFHIKTRSFRFHCTTQCGK